MPLIQIKLLDEIFSIRQKQEVIEKITELMVEVVGENIRPVTWVLIEEIKNSNWGINGKAVSLGDIRNTQANNVRAGATGHDTKEYEA